MEREGLTQLNDPNMWNQPLIESKKKGYKSTLPTHTEAQFLICLFLHTAICEAI